MLNARYYLTILDNFVSRGDIPETDNTSCRAWQKTDDPLLDYLLRLMNDPETQKKILSSRIRGRVFYTTVGRFVVESINNNNFQRQRQWTERKNAEDVLEWSNAKREDKWKNLLQQIDKDHHDDGFHRGFYEKLFSNQKEREKTQNWEKLVHDWKNCMDRQLLSRQRERIKAHSEGEKRALELALHQIEEHISSHSINEDKALQAWDMMEGQWTETEFEKHLKIIQIQDKYPEIGQVARKMGRIAEGNGRDRMTIASGARMKLSHSSGSDIEGITVGNDLNSLLPIELAEYGDDKMGDLFIYKYFTKRLQTFRYKSQMSKPSRRLDFTHAARRGPMIICIDTSASMYGTAQRIEESLLSKVEQVAEELGRDCFLINFSVSIYPIDLIEKKRNERMSQIGITQPSVNETTSLLQVTERRKDTSIPFIGGGTSAGNMLNTLFTLLDNDGNRYVNADVLWITDFLIPMADASMLAQLDIYRKTGTKFYGMQISEGDECENKWQRYFNKIYHIRYRQLRRY